MKLQLVSEDDSLLSLCRQIATEFPGIGWHIHTSTDSLQELDADLCIWDYRPGLVIPGNKRWATKCFVLVASPDLESFRAAHSYAEAAIVLKPVTRAVLRALMAQVAASTPQPDQIGTYSMRSDRNDILQCLIEANLRLQQYDAERTNFLGRALHDFHAPLTAVSGYCGLLIDEKVGLLEERQKVVINRMHHSVRRLSRMSRAMFQLSVGRHIPVNPSLREADIRDCVEQALYELQQLAEEKELQLDVDLQTTDAPLWIDSGQVEQVMINLLENACKFSPRSALITVKGYPCFYDRRATNVFCDAQADRRVSQVRLSNAYRIDIADSGPGISQEHLASIFEEYVSYSGGQDRSRGGLGLAICRMIVDNHQGRIWAQNNPSGAVFSFVLPFHPSDGGHEHANIAYDVTRSDLSECAYDAGKKNYSDWRG